MKRQVGLAGLLGLLIVVLCPRGVYAQTTLDELIAADRLRISAELIAPEKIVVKAPVIVRVTIATERWFAKGSRLGKVDLGDVVIPPASELAINGSTTINGSTWVTQARDLVMYPTKPGQYTLPPVAVTVSVNTTEGLVEGELSTPPLSFEVFIPPELVGIPDYIISPDASIEVDVSEIPDEGLSVGDAVTLSIKLMAADMPAMMFPPWDFPKFSGVNLYSQPASINDQSVRGDNVAFKEQSITYIFEAGGDFVFPKQTLHWWDSNEQVLKTLVIPEYQWNVAGAPVSALQKLPKAERWAYVLKVLVVVAVIIAALLVLRRVIPRLNVRFGITAKLTRRRHGKAFIAELQAGRYGHALDALYHYYGLPKGDIATMRKRCQHDNHALAALNNIYRAAFAIDGTAHVNPFELARQGRVLIALEPYKQTNNAQYFVLNRHS